MTLKRAVALILLLASTHAAGAQLDPAPSPDSSSEPDKPVRISAVVMDRQGRPVTGLTSKDFELRDDGVVQRIESVESRTPKPRRLALLLDEFHVAEAEAPRVREALRVFVDNRLRADDLVVVLKPLDSLSSIRLTSERDEIQRAIATFEGRAGNYEPRTPLEEQTVGRAPALAERARAQIVLSALRALAARLGSAEGRAAIVLVSGGFQQEPRAIAARALPDLVIVERFANRYDVPVYAIDPQITDDPTDRPSRALLRRLAAETGGFFRSGQELIALLNEVSQELDGGYVLAYRPAHGDDGKFHQVEVRVRRHNAEVRTRAGYVAAPSAEMRRAMRASLAPPEPPRLLRRSPLIEVWSGVTRAVETQARVVVTWQPGRSVPGANSPRAAIVELKATTNDRRLVFDGSLGPVRSPREPGGMPPDRAEFDVPAGRVQLDMRILNETGEKIDEDARDLVVPNLSGPGTLLLPPVLLATRSAREFREVTADENAAPAPTRQFSRTERLLIRVPVYAPGKIEPQVTARLLNRVGQLMRELDRVPHAQIEGVTQFDLPLAPLAPGEYYLQLTATSDGGSAEERVSFRITG